MFELAYADTDGLKYERACSMTFLEDDVTLSELFAAFVEATRIMGYSAKSWNDIVDMLSEILNDPAAQENEYDIFSWATDVYAEAKVDAL